MKLFRIKYIDGKIGYVAARDIFTAGELIDDEFVVIEMVAEEIKVEACG